MTQHTSIRYQSGTAQARNTTGQQGFTLVELVLATAFIAFILIFMLAAMLQTMNNYNKGLAVKQINQSARTVMEEMSRLIQATSGSAVNTAYLSNGRVCFGGVSYVWNIKGTTTNKYTSGSSFTMVRVNDTAGALCSAALPNINQANATELLSGQIWVQQVNVAVSSNQRLVDITIGLSTSSPNDPTGTDPILGTICLGDRDGQYCAVATFRTTVSTKDGGG
jgi:type II secretory pathway pseudopilin PulG